MQSYNSRSIIYKLYPCVYLCLVKDTAQDCVIPSKWRLGESENVLANGHRSQENQL